MAYKFEGWVGHDKESANGKMVWQEFTPKRFEETDVDIRISHCGVCGSDIHTLRSGWSPTIYPVVCGHEIVGRVVRVGRKVNLSSQSDKNDDDRTVSIKVGDRVGVGAQSSSCLRAECHECTSGIENHCPTRANVATYNARYASGDVAMGGYATYWRGPAHFVFKIPDEIPSDVAAPMLCGGITAFSPLVRNGAGPGKRVGIVGIGGLGHFGIMAAKVLGCERVVAISRTSSKMEDALKMGADDFIATDEDKTWYKKHAASLDLIICTVSSPKMPLEQYLRLLRTFGQFIQIGAPEDVLPPIRAFSLLSRGVKIGGSMIGSPNEIRQMLDLFAKKGVRTWNNNVPMKDANKAIVDMEDGKARYRIVLVNDDDAKRTSHL